MAINHFVLETRLITVAAEAFMASYHFEENVQLHSQGPVVVLLCSSQKQKHGIIKAVYLREEDRVIAGLG